MASRDHVLCNATSNVAINIVFNRTATLPSDLFRWRKVEPTDADIMDRIVLLLKGGRDVVS
jgi:hypothetical protein